MWRDQPVDLKKWLRDYCLQRYGACPPEMEQAWEILSRTLYEWRFPEQDVYSMRPSPNPTSKPPCDPPRVREAVRLLIACSDRLGKSDLYRRDLVDVLKQYLADGASCLLSEFNRAYQNGNKAEMESYSEQYMALLDDIDRLVATRPEYHLSHWIAATRRWGKSKEESDLYEQNARMQVTIWGGKNLNDYAWKGWTGLITDFYIPRWRLFFDKLKRSEPGKPFDWKWKAFIAHWEEQWTKQTDPPREMKAGDTIAIARELFTKYGDWPDRWEMKKEARPDAH
jgi:alpha-N-acetylglucosaminidase